MKLISRLFLLIIICCTVIPAWADSPKIAIIDVQRALLNTDTARLRLKEMETNKNYVEARNDMREIEESLRSMQQEIGKEGTTWSAEKKQEQLTKLQYKQADWEKKKKKVVAEQQAVQKRLAEEMNAQVEEALVKIIEEENIGLLLDSRAVIHATVDFDISDKVTQKLNELKLDKQR